MGKEGGWLVFLYGWNSEFITINPPDSLYTEKQQSCRGDSYPFTIKKLLRNQKQHFHNPEGKLILHDPITKIYSDSLLSWTWLKPSIVSVDTCIDMIVIWCSVSNDLLFDIWKICVDLQEKMTKL